MRSFISEISGSHGSEYEDASIIRVLMMKPISTSEMQVNFFQTTLSNIPEDCHLQEFHKF
jgi:hypothetical protein